LSRIGDRVSLFNSNEASGEGLLQAEKGKTFDLVSMFGGRIAGERSLSVSLVRGSNGKPVYRVQADYRDVAGPLVSAKAKSAFFKQAQSDTFSADAKANFSLGSGSRTIYEARTPQEAQRIAELLSRRMQDRTSLSDADYRWLGQRRVEVHQSGSVSGQLRLGQQVNVNTEGPPQRGFFRRRTPEDKPAFTRNAFAVAGVVGLEGRPYLAYLPSSGNGTSARMRVGVSLESSGQDSFESPYLAREAGVDRRLEFGAKTSRQQETGLGSHAGYLEFELSAADVRRIERADGKVSPEHAAAIIGSGRRVYAAGTAVSSRSRDSLVNTTDHEGRMTAPYKSVAGLIRIDRPTGPQLKTLFSPASHGIQRSSLESAHVDLALAGSGTVSTRVRTQSFLRREHSRADELFAGYADLTKFAVNGRRRSQADESLRYFEEEVRPMSR
jgi:hypothetical protein